MKTLQTIMKSYMEEAEINDMKVKVNGDDL